MVSQQIGRLALRQEDEWWKAYYAKPDTMDGALLIGQIHMRTVTTGKHAIKRKRAFMLLMMDVVGDMVEVATGERLSWPEGPQPVPEHERKV